MSTALIPASSGATERFANPLQQIKGVMAQPAVRRSLPMALMVGLIAAAALAWMSLSTPTQKTLFSGLPDSDKAAVTSALTTANIKSHIDEGTGALTVGEDDYSRAKMLLAGQGLPKAAPGGYAILDQLPMGVSRAVEGERLRQARESEMAKSIEEIDAVAEARVHLAMPEASVFVRDNAAPSASVILKLQGGRSLSEAQVASIINLVASSVPGMKPEAVTIVDQMGALLTKAGGSDGAGAASDARIDIQRRIEDKYRTQLIALLTPLVGAGNFTAEVQADVNLDESQATRESYEKQGVLRAETGNWTGNQKDGAAGAPGGIPGALSNTPPAASTLSAPQAATGNPGAPAGQPVAGGPAPDAMKQSDQYQRAYDLGREVSVTRATPGGVKRLSVAVLLRDPEKGRRTAMEINQITDLVKSAVGFDQARNDNVTVISRKFAGVDAAADAGPSWYDNAWLPVLARNGTAILIALLVLLLGVRPIAKALMKKRDDAGARPALGQPIGAANADGMTVAAPVSLDQLENTRGYDDRIGAVRGFTRDNPTRAALAVRDMIKADAK
ncbi:MULTISPECIES: flagellar basal-body MS-ring/collar protein FliF [unclassified Sphingomonas]|uniref:flagellar basal-body MS-ring/collar protein FliF n=1 Tax=unclassified Sphingomonas TaxID=196159 RepID=UPI0006F22CB9|nr:MULTISPECIES: flagellar basal-body MS-ring/collar protein FliF [unclassified Sphingomonas]KQN28869.1 flagellar M-ring protein FliF [Sphingomonas sp. Leaf38]KQN31942.1 flagellar M-ring protein FliF [Sphingomonas sp. Leaf34]